MACLVPPESILVRRKALNFDLFQLVMGLYSRILLIDIPRLNIAFLTVLLSVIVSENQCGKYKAWNETAVILDYMPTLF